MSATRNVLLLGGHGKVSLYLTPLLRNFGWSVTSVIRDAKQKSAIETAAGPGKGGSLTVLVHSLEDVKSEADAKAVIDAAGAVDTVVWSAGAGGKGGASRTYAIDRDAAMHFIAASVSDPRVKTFLLVSAVSVRRHKAPWWSEQDWDGVQKVNTQVMPDYYKAKLAADEFLTVKGRARVQKDGEGKFSYLVLRPGGLTDGDAEGKVTFGKTKGRGTIKRADVAGVAAELLKQEGGSGWFDLLQGDEAVDEAVAKVFKQGIDCVEGENIEEMEKDIKL